MNTTGMILTACGGLGLFLVGMFVMTDGLKALAGNGLKRFIARFTHSPVSGAATGAAATALIQSSSATTVVAVGFVGAGLMTFTQALGIIFGANIGTTITGWLVALVGFKLKIGLIAGPMVLIGAVIRLFARDKLQQCGQTLAGFGLIFIGITMLQDGLAGLGDVITPESFPDNSWGGRLLLVLIGIIITLITQSSSAGVATAITAVFAGTISLPQAAAMVIGMDIGTTITAYMATMGGSTQARRTGYAHVIYNVMTGTAAYLMLVPFLNGLERLAPWVVKDDPELALVTFHTCFNLIGVLVVLPFTQQFANLIERLVPDKGHPAKSRLDREMLRDPDAAAGLASTVLRALLSRACTLTISSLKGNERAMEKIDILEKENHQLREDLFKIRLNPPTLPPRVLSVLHVVDHLDRLLDRLKLNQPVGAPEPTDLLKEPATLLGAHVSEFKDWLDNPEKPKPDSEALWKTVDAGHDHLRHAIMEAGTHGVLSADEVMMELDGERWLRRTSYHIARASFYLSGVTNKDGPEEDDAELRKRDPDPA